MTDDADPRAQLLSVPAATVQQLAPVDLDARMRYAQALAFAGVLPPVYRRQPANLLYALAYADALDLPLPAILTGLHVIDGKPGLSAQLMAAVVRRAGHRLRSTGDDRQAVAELTRRDDPDYTFRAVFTLEDAARAGLLQRDNWHAYPAAMLKARAIAAVCREACPEALAGAAYVPDELTRAGDPPHTDTVPDQAEPLTGRLTRGTGPDPDDPWTRPDPAPPPPVCGPDAPVTDAQLRMLGVLCTRAGLTDRADAIELVAAVIGRPVASRSELTRGEASRVIEHLSDLVGPPDEPPPAGDGPGGSV